jgi:TetR/AcrR family transcriptional repressor of nem operon
MHTTPTRTRIIDAADRLFAMRGYAATSLADVASEAGVLKGNLAYYFPTRQALGEAVVEQRRRTWVEFLESLEGLAPGRAIEQVLIRIREQAQDVARCGCSLGGLAAELARCEPDLGMAAAQGLRILQDFLATRLLPLVPDQSPEQAAERLLGSLQGAALLSQLQHDPEVVRRAVDDARAWLAGLKD